MIDQVITVYKDLWELKSDNLWYTHIPTLFDCDETSDTILELADTSEYIQEHSRVFDSLVDGKTGKNEVIISCRVKPDCDIKVIIKTLEQAGGKILYNADGTPEYVPDNNNDLLSLLATVNSIEKPEEEKKEEYKKIVL